MDPIQTLEQDIDRELKRLKDLPAPRSLIPGVLARIEARAAQTARRHCWQSWPTPVRAVCFILLLALFGGLCFGAWQLWQLGSAQLAAGKLATWLAPIGAVWSVICAVGTAAVALVTHLGTGFLVACLTVAAFSYLTCVGVGTLMVRFAFARSDERRNSI